MGFVPTPSDFMTVQDLKEAGDWPLPWTASKGLIPYIKRLKGEVHGIEIGTARGESAYHILESCPNVSLLTTIDPFLEYIDWIGVIDQHTMDQFQDLANKNLLEFGGRVDIQVNSSDEVKDQFADNSISFLFVDGNHSKNDVLNDLTGYYPKVVLNGIVAVHDTNLESVNDAIKEFRETNKIRTPLNKLPNSVVFWTKQ